MEERASRLERIIREFLPSTSGTTLDSEFWKIHEKTQGMDRRSSEARRLWRDYWAKKRRAMELEGRKPEVRTPERIRWDIERLERSIRAQRLRLEKGVYWNGKDKGKPLPNEELTKYVKSIQSYEERTAELKKELEFLSGQ